MTLYELTGQYAELMQIAENETLDKQVIEDTLEGLEGEIEDKAEAYACVIKTLEGNINSLDAEIHRLTDKKNAMKNNISRIKENLENTMIIMDKKKFSTGLFSFNIQKNAPSLDVIDESKIPEEFYIPQEPKLDRKSALDFIKKNGETKWGKLKQSESLRIR